MCNEGEMGSGGGGGGGGERENPLVPLSDPAPAPISMPAGKQATLDACRPSNIWKEALD